MRYAAASCTRQYIMAHYYTANEAASLLFDEGLVDSGDESDIEEDPSFPLPHDEDESTVSVEQPHPPFTSPTLVQSLEQEPLPPPPFHSDCMQTLELELDPSSGDLPTSVLLPGPSRNRGTRYSKYLCKISMLQNKYATCASLDTDMMTSVSDGGQGTSMPARHVSASIILPAWNPVQSTSDTSFPPLPFNQYVGSTLQLPQDSQPVDFFRHLMDDNIIDLLVEETNQ